MRVIFTIPHFFGPRGVAKPDRRHGAHTADPRDRVNALTSCLRNLHRLFHPAQRIINLTTKRTSSSNEPLVCEQLDIVLVTTGQYHLVNALPLPAEAFRHCKTDAEPLMVGFVCHEVLRDHLGEYDYYCYVEDDLVIHDPWLFQKLTWFTRHVGDDKLLLPNRYEFGDDSLAYKAYVDGELHSRTWAHLAKPCAEACLKSSVMGMDIEFRRPTNPHSGCFFLNARQMSAWAAADWFLDRDTSFVGPLESAATLGVMRTFSIYKPASRNASFLEIEHFGNQFVRQLRPQPEDPSNRLRQAP